VEPFCFSDARWKYIGYACQHNDKLPTANKEKSMLVRFCSVFGAGLATTCAGIVFAQAPAAAPAAAPQFAASNLTPSGVRSLAANCAACHGTNGNSAGGAVAGLAGLDKDYVINQMKLFKEGKREATLMHQIAKGYTDAEIAALAEYFSTQKK
jgi:cytochrome subunit of sulfide dehydrogenase